MKKQLLRVKQIADQTFLRAEKTEVLTEDLLIAEKRVDSIKLSCQSTQKKITSCQIDFGSENSNEKRLKKIPQMNLAASMIESGNSFTKNSILGDILKESAAIQIKLGTDLLEYYNEVEKHVLKPVTGVLDNEIHNINKLRKQLGKLVLDMDSARTRFQTAERHSLQQSCNTNLNVVGKVDTLKEELEEASQKVEQCRDYLAAEMFSLISREPHIAQLLVQFHQLQVTYHKNSLAALESSLPALENLICNFPQKPVYGYSLEEHLRVTHRDIAQVIEICVSFLTEYALSEEGLFRIAGSTTKLKKIKTAFDAGIDIDLTDFIRDPHAVSGALKSYLRELPEPILTFKLYNEWMNAIKIQESDAKLQALWQVLYKLPDANFKNLRFLIKFLAKLIENVEANKMSSQNIAIVMAPNLIWSPSEDSATLGMNMSTASQHTAIVELIISYSDWFFPEDDNKNQLTAEDISSNLVEDKSCTLSISEVEESTVEMNGNNIQTLNSIPTSPRSPHKGTKKLAAPPPPAPRSSSKDFSEDLIDLNKDSINLCVKTNELDEKCMDQSNMLINKIDSCKTIEKNTNRNEKPTIPEKPGYSSMSLDRRSFRHSSSTKVAKVCSGNRTSDIIQRSYIERPSVPPPERPVKPPKLCSSIKNVDNAENSNTQIAAESVNTAAIPDCLYPDLTKIEMNSVESTAKADISPSILQHSTSCSKVNRFDFLVNQKEDKPPERPPRTCLPPSEYKHDSAQNSNTEVPKTSDIEKIKPARPQPPLPAKPKFPVHSENTNL